MKKIKKLGMVAIVIAMCALLGVTVWAAESATVDYSYTVEVDNTVFCVGTERTVTVTVKANKALDVNSVGATIALQGCTLVEDSLTVPGMVKDDVWLYFDGDFAWAKDDSVDVNTQTLLTFQVTIPEDAAVGDYKIEVKDVILTQLTGGMKTLKAGNTTASATVTIKAHEYEEEEGCHWTGEQNNMSCTVNGVCACGATTTATANATGTVKDPATCTAKGNTTYTATFAEEWVGIRTHTLTDIPALDHSYTGKIKNDGETHSYQCVNGCNLYGDAVGHTYTNGECVCGDLETYTVTWVKENGDVVYTETVKYGKDAQNIPQLPYEKPGYTASWSHNGKGITQNTTIEMVFTENTYRVEIYSASGINTLGTKEGLYTKWISTNIGNFSSLVTPVAGYDAGFSLEPNGEMVCGTNIGPGNLNILTENAVYDAGTGKYVLKLYVARTPKTYYITWYVDGKMYDSMSYKYGEAVSDYTYTPSKSKNGCTVYTFDRWDSELPETMPAQNVTINAIFMETKDHTDGTVSYQDNENGTHDAICSCGTVLEDNATHIYTDGECVCGAEKPAPAGLKGDIDLDGDVDMDDLTYFAKHIAKIITITDAQSLENADVTGDGEVTMDDLTKLAKYIAKIIPDLD